MQNFNNGQMWLGNRLTAGKQPVGMLSQPKKVLTVLLVL
jgi:hypothetical protein